MIYYIIAAWIVGMVGGFFLKKLLGRRKKYFGSIVVTGQEGITLFSLELKGEPEEILNHQEVTFKVEIPDEESDRE